MKKRILLVDGYNMIAFWKETRQLFKINQLDEARETLLRAEPRARLPERTR